MDNIYNNNNELILFDHRNPIIYLTNKKNEQISEYFIWSHNKIISRALVSKHLFIDATFYKSKDFSQILIILFKDIIL